MYHVWPAAAPIGRWEESAWDDKAGRRCGRIAVEEGQEGVVRRNKSRKDRRRGEEACQTRRETSTYILVHATTSQERKGGRGWAEISKHATHRILLV